MDERERRLVLNETLFREVNERIERISAGMRASNDIDVVCECGELGCDDRIRLSIAQYEEVRSTSSRYVVRPGHERAEIESVVEEHDGWYVIEKRPGGPAELSKQTDPRS